MTNVIEKLKLFEYYILTFMSSTTTLTGHYCSQQKMATRKANTVVYNISTVVKAYGILGYMKRWSKEVATTCCLCIRILVHTFYPHVYCCWFTWISMYLCCVHCVHIAPCSVCFRCVFVIYLLFLFIVHAILYYTTKNTCSLYFFILLYS